MAKNDVKVGDNPKLKQKIMSDGNYSLYLDYYLGRVNVTDEATGEIKSKVQRKREFLHLTLFATPRTPIERQQNKDTLDLAQKIRFEREQKFKEDNLGYRLKKKKQDINFLDYFQNYIDKYTKKDIRMIKIALQRFKDFLRDTPEYTKYKDRITPQQINRDMVIYFTEYLQSRSVGEGAKSIFQRFKKVFKSCANDYNFNYSKPFTKDDGETISISIDDKQLRKEILTLRKCNS